VMRPYQGLNTLTATANVANNRYDSLQVSLNKRFGSGLTFQVAYTNGRLLSEQENVGLYMYNWKQYTGYVSGTNRRQTTAINYVYALPKFSSKLVWNNRVTRTALDGWQLAHLLTFFGGQPYSPGFSVVQANTTSSVSAPLVFLGTPDLTPRLAINGPLGPTNPTMAFNPSNLGVPGIFPAADGTGPRNFLTAPGTFVNDISLVKMIRIRESKTLEFRVDAFNLFNQVRRVNLNTSEQYKANGAAFSQGFSVYNTPEELAQRAIASGTTSSTGIFNQYILGVGYPTMTSTEPARIIQLSAKFRF
jgi:hypothetical protein